MTSTLPKRPVSDYIHYCAVARDQIKSANPDLKTKDIVVQMGAGWKQLSPEEKEKYSALAKLDKERYTKEMESWTANNPGVVIEKKVKVKKAKKAVEVPAPASEEEIVISEEELVQPAVADKPKKTRKAKTVAAPEPAVAAPPAPVVPAPVAAPVEKEKKPPSRYQNFLKVQRPLLKESKPDLKPKEVLTELGAMWSKLSLKEQEQY
jgi:hypothetical protein